MKDVIKKEYVSQFDYSQNMFQKYKNMKAAITFLKTY